jgi:Uncharacterized protein conserved in bacteria
MGVWDKLLNAMKLGEEEEDDDFFDDDYYEEEPPKKSGIFKRLEEEDDDDYGDDEFLDSERKRRPSPQPSRPATTSNKVTPMRGNKRTNSSMEVCVIKPTSMEDTREITETLLSNRPVVLNLEGLDIEIAQRIIDFTSGSTYAISGNLQKISNYIFIITPSSVDISGDFQGVISGSFDVPSIQTGY